jgi:hypothetical protein
MMGSRAGIVLLIVAVALTAAAVIAADQGAFHFVGADDWLGIIPDTAREWGGVGLTVILFAVFAAVFVVFYRSRSCELKRVHVVAAVPLLVVTAFVLHQSTAVVRPGGTHESVAALAFPKTNVFYHRARAIRSVDEFLHGYESRISSSSDMPTQTHPPGPEVFYRLLQDFFHWSPAARDAAAALSGLGGTDGPIIETAEMRASLAAIGMADIDVDVARGVALILQLIACLAIVPVYLLGASLHSRRAGLLAAAFVALLPSVHCFSPGLDQTYIFCAALLGWLAVMAIGGRHWWAGALFGAWLALSLLFSLAFIAVVAVVGLCAVVFAGRVLRTTERSLSDYWWPLGASVAGFVVVVLMFAIRWEMNLFGVWSRCLSANAQFNRMTQRPYLPALLSNALEYLIFMGVPLACLLVAGLSRAARRIRLSTGAAMLILCFATVMIVLNLLGVNRGEVARLWMFTMPFCAVAGAWWLEERRAPMWLTLALLTVQFVQLVCFRVILDALLLYPTAT